MAEDKILLTGMVFHGHTGVYPYEKREGQVFIVDLELRMGRIPACLSDDLDIKLSDFTINQYPRVVSVLVTVKKPMAPVDGRFSHMAVSIERTQEDMQ